MDNRETLASLLNKPKAPAQTPSDYVERDREHGTIEWFNATSYGFIKPDLDAPDVFFHVSECDFPMDQIKAGTRVSYIIGAARPSGRDPRLCAKQIRLLNGDA